MSYMKTINGDSMMRPYVIEDSIYDSSRTPHGDGFGDGPIATTDSGDSYGPYYGDGD